MKAILRNYNQPPRKVRLVADVIRGKTVERALAELSVLPKKSTDAFAKLLRSAVANAKGSKNLSAENLFIKDVAVDKDMTLKRFRPAWRGTRHPIRRVRSRIAILLDEEKNRRARRKKKRASAKK